MGRWGWVINARNARPEKYINNKAAPWGSSSRTSGLNSCKTSPSGPGTWTVLFPQSGCSSLVSSDAPYPTPACEIIVKSLSWWRQASLLSCCSMTNWSGERFLASANRRHQISFNCRKCGREIKPTAAFKSREIVNDGGQCYKNTPSHLIVVSPPAYRNTLMAASVMANVLPSRLVSTKQQTHHLCSSLFCKRGGSVFVSVSVCLISRGCVELVSCGCELWIVSGCNAHTNDRYKLWLVGNAATYNAAAMYHALYQAIGAPVWRLVHQFVPVWTFPMCVGSLHCRHHDIHVSMLALHVLNSFKISFHNPSSLLLNLLFEGLHGLL